MHPYHRTTVLWSVLAALAVTLCAARPVSAQVPPPNDECQGAISLPLPADVTGSTASASVSSEPPAFDLCGPDGFAHNARDVWYSVVGTGNTITISTCNAGTDYDTQLDVYCGTCDGTVCVTGNDDQPGGCAAAFFASTLSWCSTSGTTYYILVHAFGSGGAGTFRLTATDGGSACTGAVTCPVASPPANDNCEDAPLLLLPASASGSTTFATISPEPPAIDMCGGVSHDSPDVWYRVVGTGNTITASTCTNFTDFDTRLHVYCGTCPGPVCVGGNDNDPIGCTITPGASTLRWCSISGTVYYVLVHGVGGATGNFLLTVTDGGTACTGAVTCPIIAQLFGACCTGCGACEELTEVGCFFAGGEFLGEQTSCSTEATAPIDTVVIGGDIPDDDSFGMFSTITVPGSFTINEVEAHLVIDHTWQGDLVVDLEHGGTTVRLLSRPGRSNALPNGNCPGNNPSGYGADDFGAPGDPLVLTDFTAVGIDCYGGGPASAGIDNYSGPARPTDLLSAFTGMEGGGDWTLRIADFYPGHTGTLTGWGLAFPDPPCPRDMTPPVLMGCPDFGPTTLECPASPPMAPTVTAVDNCDGDVDVDFVETMTDDLCREFINRTWTAVDNSGNDAVCRQSFFIQDTTGPVLTCAPSPIVVTCTGPEGIAGAEVDIPLPTAIDECNTVGPIGFTTPDVFSPTCDGEPHVVTFSANDSCLNPGTCTVEIIVKGALCCPALVDEELTLMIPNLDFTAQPGHDGGPVTTKAKFDIWNQNEIRFSGLNKCITCWDSTLLSLYPMPNHFLASNIQTDMGRARIDGVAEPQCVGAVATPLLGIITREITFAGCPLPSLRSSRPLTARGTQDASILYSPIDQRSADDDALRVGPPENVAGTNRQGALLVWAKVEVKWDFAGEIIRDTFIELTNDGDEFIDFQLYLVNGEGPLDEVRLFGVLLERAHQGWNYTDEQIRLTPNEPTFWSANTGAPKGITPFSNLDGGPPLGRPDLDPRNPGGRMVRGFVVGWAVNAGGEEVKYNRLGGRATIVDYAEGSAHEYETWVFRCVAPVADLAAPDGTPGRLLLDGMEYDAAPEKLITQFFVPWSPAFTNRGALGNFGPGMDTTGP